MVRVRITVRGASMRMRMRMRTNNTRMRTQLKGEVDIISESAKSASDIVEDTQRVQTATHRS